MKARFWFAAPAVGLLAMVVGLLGSVSIAGATPGSLGGLDISGYCFGLGYDGNNAPNTALVKGGISGTNFAYGNWNCVDGAGRDIPIATTGAAPSMTDVCHAQYLGVASYASPTDANDAYTWNCYLLPPSSGPGVGQETQAAVGALMSTDAVQAEIVHLQTLGPHPIQVEWQLIQFLVQQPSQELITDVLGGYGLPRQQFVVSVGLDGAMLRAILHQP